MWVALSVEKFSHFWKDTSLWEWVLQGSYVENLPSVESLSVWQLWQMMEILKIGLSVRPIGHWGSCPWKELNGFGGTTEISWEQVVIVRLKHESFSVRSFGNVLSFLDRYCCHFSAIRHYLLTQGQRNSPPTWSEPLKWKTVLSILYRAVGLGYFIIVMKNGLMWYFKIKYLSLNIFFHI